MFKEDKIHKDKIGNVLSIDDVVVFNPPRYKGIKLGKIIRFTEKGVRVQFKARAQDTELSDTAVADGDVLKVDSAQATMYVLKKGGI